MKKQLSLKLSVALAFLFLGIVIVLAYSAISRHFFILGMDNIVSANMEQAAKSYIDTQPTEKRQHNNEFGGYDISHDWSQQPTIIQQKFNGPKQANQLYKFIEAPWFSSPDVIHFLISLNINGEDFFSKKILTAESSGRPLPAILASHHLIMKPKYHFQQVKYNRLYDLSLD